MSTSRAVIISAISTRGGASRMSIPDGSRQSTSWRSDSATRSVGRSRIDGASTGTLRSARRSPNWRLPSISTVRWPCWPSATARLNASVVLPTPPFGAKTEKMRDAPTVVVVSNSLRTGVDPGEQVEARERHREDAVDAGLDVGRDGVLGDGQDDDRDVEVGLVDLLDELEALDPALQQRVDEDRRPGGAAGSGG